jgi:hypothetical protein
LNGICSVAKDVQQMPSKAQKNQKTSRNLEASQMKKLFAGILCVFVCAIAYAGAGWSTQKLLDHYGSPTDSTVTHLVLGNLDFGVCDVYHWGEYEDITAYILRADWHGWSAGTVCYEMAVTGHKTIISQVIGQDGIWETVWMPQKSTMRQIFSKKAAEESTQKDIDDLNKFKEQMEGH